MASKNPPSSFVQSALDLEEVFAGIEQLSGSIERLELNSESGLERAKQLLVRFTEKSQLLQPALITLLQSLEERRGSVERAVSAVNDKAPLIAEKFKEAEEKLARFQALAERVRVVTETATRLGPVEVRKRLQEMSDEAAGLQEEARNSKLRTLEKNAQNLRLNLREIARKLDGA